MLRGPAVPKMGPDPLVVSRGPGTNRIKQSITNIYLDDRGYRAMYMRGGKSYRSKRFKTQEEAFVALTAIKQRVGV